MLTRTCTKCGWEYPADYIGAKCMFCKINLPQQYCRSCDTWKEITDFNIHPSGSPRTECKICGRERKRKFDKEHYEWRHAKDRRFIYKRKAEREAQYEGWKETIRKLPFKVLSEASWLEACSYFNGCAVCGAEHIEVRQFFIPFQDGGRYASWNIYPMCGECGKVLKKQPNTFAWFDKYLGRPESLGMTPERFDRLIDYLQLQIDKAVKEHEQEAGSV